MRRCTRHFQEELPATTKSYSPPLRLHRPIAKAISHGAVLAGFTGGPWTVLVSSPSVAGARLQPPGCFTAPSRGGSSTRLTRKPPCDGLGRLHVQGITSRRPQWGNLVLSPFNPFARYSRDDLC